MTPEVEALELLGPGWDALVASGRRHASRVWLLHGDEGLRKARADARREADRFLAGRWVLALRGTVTEPHGTDGWDSGVRLAVAEALARRLAARGVDPDLVAVLVAGWGTTYCDPPLVEEEAVVAAHRAFGVTRMAA